MKTIKNSKELAKLVDENQDLHLEGRDVSIEFQFTKEELRDVYCNDLFLMNDDERFDFNGRNFNGRNFDGRNFNGYDFNGWDFNGLDFNGYDFNGRNFNGRNFDGWDFNGWDFNGRNFDGLYFNGKKVSYYAFFNCYGSIKCESIKGKRENHAEPICLDGELEIKTKEETIKIGDHTYPKSEVEKRLQGLKEI